MTATWIDAGSEHHFAQHSLPKLVSAYLEPVDPREATTKTLRLVDLLLLSNHVAKANELIQALYKYGENIAPADPHHSNPPLKYTSFSLENFWLAHGDTYSRPENAPVFTRCSHRCKSAEENLAYEQWGKFREANRTGWMLEHCKLPEPEDPHVWKESDDPRMLAMCCRLLCKNKTQGKYVSQKRMKEALEAAKKLYAQRQVCVSEWDYKQARTRGEKRHSDLLYRRLVVELAIRVGELETAAEMLSLGLRVDGFNHGSDLYHYLMLPGIYDVLPLLARRGKEGSPFFIDEKDVDIIVRKIVETLELRVTKGRQWSLAPEKVGWKELLDRLAKGAWKVNRKEYKQMGVTCWEDILYDPADEDEIKAAEEKHGELPKDFKDMMRVAAGFKGGYHLFGGGICGVPLVDGEPEDDFEHFISDFGHLGFRQDNVTGKVIQIQAGADECDCFRHYIIPPAVWKANIVGREVQEGDYQYFNWAPWRCSISSWDSVRDFVASCVEEVEEMIEKGLKVDHGNDSDQDPDSGDEEDATVEDEEQSSDEWVHVEKE